MKFSKEVILAVAHAMSVFASSQEAVAPEDSDVVKLTGENFRGFLEENSMVLAEFFAPWCGHCKNLAPEYVVAAERLKDKGVVLAQIDCTEEEKLCTELEVRSYPTMKIFRNGKPENGDEYVGGRTADSIVSYMLRQKQPAVTSLEGNTNSEEFKKYFEEMDSPIVVNGEKNKSMNQSFHELASQFRNDYTFIQLSDDDTGLSVYLKGEKKPIVYKGSEEDVEALSKWLKLETLPFFGEVTPETYASYIGSGLPIAYYFYSEPEQRAELESFFVKLGKEHRGKLLFTGLDATKFGRFAATLNMEEQFPLFVIQNVTASLKYGLPQLSKEEYEALSSPQQLNKKDIAKLAKDFLAGKAEPTVRTEDIPTVQETNVYKLVGLSHDEIVKEGKKDVLVKYYAPWCGHCRTLAPTYETLADLYASDEDAKEKILIADIDSTRNDVVAGFEIAGFPTIILYPSGEGSEPVMYEGDRSIDSLLTFIKEKGTHKVDGSPIYEAFQEKAAAEAEEEVAEEAVEEEAADLEHDEL